MPSHETILFAFFFLEWIQRPYGLKKALKSPKLAKMAFLPFHTFFLFTSHFHTKENENLSSLQTHNFGVPSLKWISPFWDFLWSYRYEQYISWLWFCLGKLKNSILVIFWPLCLKLPIWTLTEKSMFPLTGLLDTPSYITLHIVQSVSAKFHD